MRSSRAFSSLIVLSLFTHTFYAPILLAAAENVRILIMPFENKGGTKNLSWVGNGMAESISEQLALPGVKVIARERRNRALMELGLPQGSPLTQATMIKIAEDVEADLLVVGTFASRKLAGSAGEELSVKVKVIDLRRMKIAEEMSQVGAVADLPGIENAIAWRILGHSGLGKLISRVEFSERRRKIANEAYADYVRSLMIKDPELQIRLLLKVLRQHPSFSPAYFRLGRVYFIRKEYENALLWLTKLHPYDLHFVQAEYLSGIANYRLGRFNDSLVSFAGVVARTGAKEPLNNLGAAYMARGDYEMARAYFEAAMKINPYESLIAFNLGLLEFKCGNNEVAARLLEQVLRRDPKDAMARYVLYKAYLNAGRSEAAEKQLSALKGEGGRAVGFQEVRMDNLQRLYEDIELDEIEEAQPDDQANRLKLDPSLITRMDELYRKGDMKAALEAIAQAVAADPLNPRAHLYHGKLLLDQKRNTDAIAEFKISLKVQSSLDAHLALARAYLERMDLVLAEREVEAALQIDPQNEEALALREAIRQKGKRG